ncbi:MAG: glycoside hydrolase family 2 protein [Lachnospiraceae bacterium]|nr:glycoside hydrolase family 2 protein [Lachnospiraceae bacterium]
MIKQMISENWKMRRVGDEDFQAAVVPGTVYTDLLRNGNMEDPFFKDNELKALKLMEEDYEYVTRFACGEELLASRKVLLRFDGVDTIADLYLNGTRIGSPDNMHRTWEYEVKQLLQPADNELRVVFHSPTKYIEKAFQASRTHGSEDAMDGFVNIRKAHCMFGWDWGAHLPDAGLFRPVMLLGMGQARIDSVYITQKHSQGQVELGFDVEANSGAGTEEYAVCGSGESGLHYRVKVTDPLGGVRTAEDSPSVMTVEQPLLWWPNGYGQQYLYTVEVTLMQGDCVLDTWERRIGLRTLTMHREKDQWGESFACQVNGVDIFAMGADYIPEDHLLGRVTPETTRTLLEKAKWANFNAVRVWGGGYYPEDWFYDLCDELGLVVWQDFMFACAVYDLTPEFEANIRAEFADNIKRLRHHASLGLWCGNNEMEDFVAQRNEWVTKPQEVRDYLFMYERIIPEVLRRYDPQTFYWPSSPSSGGSFDDAQDPNRGDVHYWQVWHGNKPFTEYRKYFFRYISEFGFQSFPTMKTIEKISDDPADYNIFSYVMEKHQRNGSANGKIMNYMQQTYRYPSDFQTVLYASQLLQADGIRYGVEHFRRNRGRCMGAIYWQLNDCWPVASWSSIDYCGRLKALHYYAKRFFAPLMLSCEEQGLMTSGKDLNRQYFDFEKSIRLNVANETMQEETVTVRWALRDAGAEVLQSGEETVTVPALTSVWLDKVEFPDADIYTQYASYEMEKDGEIISSGTVNFSYPKYFRYEDPKLRCSVNGDEITVIAVTYAKSVEILNENEDLILSDNYFDMNGGSKTVKIESGDPSNLRLRSVYDIR